MFTRMLSLAFVGVTIIGPQSCHHDDEPTPERIEEDDPRWDCTTMGNRTCGDLVYDEDPAMACFPTDRRTGELVDVCVMPEEGF